MTKVFIPYFAEDEGGRPLPSKYSSAMCYSIRPDRKIGNAYPGRGVPFYTEIRIRAKNINPATTLVFVDLYWAALSTNTPRPQQIAKRVSKTISYDGDFGLMVYGQIPRSAPLHICMLAMVTSDDDPADPLGKPGIDAHWAQLNLRDVPLAAGAHYEFDFVVSNGDEQPRKTYMVVGQPVTGQRLEALGDLTGRELIDARDVNFSLTNNKTGEISGSDGTLFVTLEPGEEHVFKLAGTVGPSHEMGDHFAMEVVQLESVNGDTFTSEVGAVSFIIDVVPDDTV